jgi:aryl-alcohol dehydrogenase-like predicted oxidoreductase
MSSENIGRRNFIKRMSSALLGLTATPVMKPTTSLAETKKTQSLEYRTLGKTGLKVTVVGMGVMNCSDPAVVLRAFDLGINFFDTADCYMWGRNEEMVGQVFQGKRDKVLIQTKVHPHEEKKMRASVERSLRRLKTDYVDVLVWHGHSHPEEVSDTKLHEFMMKMKKEGKARFTGFSAHSRMAALLREAAKFDYHDVALVSYNFTHSKELKEAVALAAKSGIGIVAMKTQAGGYKRGRMEGLSPHQAALKYVLMDQNVSVAVPGATTIGEIEESGAVMGTSFSTRNVDELKQYHGFLHRRICTLCDGCTGECPHDVPYRDLLRAVMYHDGYQSDLLAKKVFSETESAQPFEKCSECSSCSVICRRGVDIRGQIQLAQQISKSLVA